MSFKMVLLPPECHEDWPDRIRELVPEAQIRIFSDPREAFEEIEDADCAYGYVPADLLGRARKLRWIQCYAAAPDPSFFHQDLVDSDVIVTNFRGIYNDGVGHHAMALLLALARDLHIYLPQQGARQWQPGGPAVHLPGRSLVIVGVGGIGDEVARVGKSFGVETIGIDPKRTDRPEYLDELYPPEQLDQVLPRADFVLITTPDTPDTRGLIDSRRLGLMKPTAFLINVGRGVCVVLDDLVEALRSETIAGAALDVFEIEPLPPGHPLWSMPNVLITPHVAAHQAPYLIERRNEVFLGNCARFARGEPLQNVVDKRNRF